jgi:hypothetical protein
MNKIFALVALVLAIWTVPAMARPEINVFTCSIIQEFPAPKVKQSA